MATDKLKKCSPSSSAGPPNWRRGNGVQRQLVEYAIASFETKKGEGK
jgi:hypothetical protein